VAEVRLFLNYLTRIDASVSDVLIWILQHGRMMKTGRQMRTIRDKLYAAQYRNTYDYLGRSLANSSSQHGWSYLTRMIDFKHDVIHINKQNLERTGVDLCVRTRLCIAKVSAQSILRKVQRISGLGRLDCAIGLSPGLNKYGGRRGGAEGRGGACSSFGETRVYGHRLQRRAVHLTFRPANSSREGKRMRARPFGSGFRDRGVVSRAKETLLFCGWKGLAQTRFRCQILWGGDWRP